MAGRVSRRGDHFERSNTLSLMQEARWLRFAGIRAHLVTLWFRRIEAQITRQQTRFSLTNSYLDIWQRLMQRVQRSNMINMRVRQYYACNRRTQRGGMLHNCLRLAGGPR